jgi:hypothetical protein
MMTRKECTTYRCEIPDEYLRDHWDSLPPEIQATIMAQGGLPCDGGGVPGAWCHETTHMVRGSSKCHWAGDWNVEDEDD